jgi:hypothetical protein
MPGDPKQCRAHVLECTQLAETALNKRRRRQTECLEATLKAREDCSGTRPL